MASRKEQKERVCAQRLRREAEEQAAARRRRLIQYGSGAGLLAVIVVVVAIVVSQSGSSASGAGAGGNVVDASLVSNQLQGIPQSDTVLGDPGARSPWSSTGTFNARSARRSPSGSPRT